MDNLLNDIETFMGARKMSAASFGRKAVGDPNLVYDMKRAGREPRPKTVERIKSFMLTYTGD